MLCLAVLNSLTRDWTRLYDSQTEDIIEIKSELKDECPIAKGLNE